MILMIILYHYQVLLEMPRHRQEMLLIAGDSMVPHIQPDFKKNNFFFLNKIKILNNVIK